LECNRTPISSPVETMYKLVWTSSVFFVLRLGLLLISNILQDLLTAYKVPPSV